MWPNAGHGWAGSYCGTGQTPRRGQSAGVPAARRRREYQRWSLQAAVPQESDGAALALQRSLLQQRLPTLQAVEFATRYLPAEPHAGVGGDWFDVIPLSGARVALVVGDVVGHGIHASAAMGRLRTAVRTLADIDLPADELLTDLDDLIIEEARERSASDGEVGATCLYEVYDPVSRHCTVASAGHPAPAMVAPHGTVDFLKVEPGPPLGVGGVPFEAVDFTLPEGSLLVLYTDGLIETRGMLMLESMVPGEGRPCEAWGSGPRERGVVAPRAVAAERLPVEYLHLPTAHMRRSGSACDPSFNG
ncbi:SpoIIE family protein phosphatase [Streptomyces sp. HUCO-GS316]|nr:SpoIIE family protein phosphatase [Streptomyces sp. HUCO-GS316]